MSAHEVHKVYDHLRELAVGMNGRGEASAEATALVTPLLVREARLLDSGRYSEWLESWSDDGLLWVPLDHTAGPAADQSLFLDDRRRLEERISWRAEESAWGQQPPSVTVRSVTGIEAWEDGAALVARSTLMLSETRRGHSQLLTGCQIHELTADHKIRTKIIQLPQLAVGVRNPSFIL